MKDRLTSLPGSRSWLRGGGLGGHGGSHGLIPPDGDGVREADHGGATGAYINI